MASAWMHWAHEGSDIDIRENGALAYNASGGGQSVRSAAALPASGKHVTEFIYGREGKDDGDDLGALKCSEFSLGTLGTFLGTLGMLLKELGMP